LVKKMPYKTKGDDDRPIAATRARSGRTAQQAEEDRRREHHPKSVEREGRKLFNRGFNDAEVATPDKGQKEKQPFNSCKS